MVEKDREGERIRWRMEMIFITFQERDAATEPLRRHFVYSPNRQMGNSPAYPFSLQYREYFPVSVFIKRCLYIAHIYIFAMTKTVSWFCMEWEWGGGCGVSSSHSRGSVSEGWETCPHPSLELWKNCFPSLDLIVLTYKIIGLDSMPCISSFNLISTPN